MGKTFIMHYSVIGNLYELYSGNKKVWQWVIKLKIGEGVFLFSFNR